jgi:hypothetical protein
MITTTRRSISTLLTLAFACALALAMTAPAALADDHWEEGEGGTAGELEHIDTTEAFIVVNAEAWFYGGAEDSYYLMLSEDGPNFDMTEAEFECVAQATVDGQANNLVMIDYDTDAGSSFGIMTDADIEVCGAQADDDDDGDDNGQWEEGAGRNRR